MYIHVYVHTYTNRVMENAKLLGKKDQEAQKAVLQASRMFAQVNMEFRTMDKDINTVRPLLMKLQREKDQYTRFIYIVHRCT